MSNEDLVAAIAVLALGIAGGIYLERKYGVSYKAERAGRAVYGGAMRVYRGGKKFYRATKAGIEAFRQTWATTV